MTDLAELLDLATRVGERAARRLVERVDDRLDIDTKSSANDFVTQVDREVEVLIVEGLRSARPGDGFVGEEGASIEGTTGIRWLIDPIDGTTNFVYGHPGFSVSIAAEVDGNVDVGVVVDPLHGDTFAAATGTGASRNGMPISTTDATELAPAVVATGFSYDADRRRRQARVLAHVLTCVGNIRRMGSAATDLCWVACGRVDAFYEEGLQPWDYAAGALIAREAGALVAGIDGGPPSTASVVAAAPGIFDALVAELIRGDQASEFSPSGTRVGPE